MNADNTLVRGLKSEVSRQVGLKNWQSNVGHYNCKHLVNSWKCLYATGITDELAEMIWDYIMNAPFQLWKKAKSDVFGVYTTIREYTNKKGIVSLAHYTENTYFGSVAKLGDKPIAYDGNFRITRERFMLDLTELPKMILNNDGYAVEQLFKPISVVVHTIVIGEKVVFKKKIRKIKPTIIEPTIIEPTIIQENQKICNICIQPKFKIDEAFKCSTCNEGFVCHECIFELCGNCKNFESDETGYCVDYKLNCPICRKQFIRSI